MSLTRNEAMSRIEGQRKAIREHIEKYNNYPYPQDKNFALRTIEICQNEIAKLKRQCNVSIPDSWEDNWTAPYYALRINELLSLRNDLVKIKDNDNKKKILK